MKQASRWPERVQCALVDGRAGLAQDARAAVGSEQGPAATRRLRIWDKMIEQYHAGAGGYDPDLAFWLVAAAVIAVAVAWGLVLCVLWALARVTSRTQSLRA